MRERVEIICKGKFENLVFGFSCLDTGAGCESLTVRGENDNGWLGEMAKPGLQQIDSQRAGPRRPFPARIASSYA